MLKNSGVGLLKCYANVNSVTSRHANQFIAAWKRVQWKIRSICPHVLGRTLNICVVVPALLLVQPLFVVRGLCIYLYDRGQVIYRPKRVGVRGVEFVFRKFCSMCTNSDAIRKRISAQNPHGNNGVTFKMKHNPRITPFGRFIRRFSIDELPQLGCMLRGDMTLVGPRPPLPSKVALYTLHDRERLIVRPGPPCIWQVDDRSEPLFPQQVETGQVHCDAAMFPLII
jgi:lipopolysaccharide/colanic/teichoic acid biosynthesis glycosyltransferase